MNDDKVETTSNTIFIQYIISDDLSSSSSASLTSLLSSSSSSASLTSLLSSSSNNEYSIPSTNGQNSSIPTYYPDSDSSSDVVCVSFRPSGYFSTVELSDDEEQLITNNTVGLDGRRRLHRTTKKRPASTKTTNKRPAKKTNKRPVKKTKTTNKRSVKKQK